MSAINLHTKYESEIQTRFTRESLINGLLSNDYSFAGVKTVRISTPITVPMTDYTRSGTSRYGTPTEMEDIVQVDEVRNSKKKRLFGIF